MQIIPHKGTHQIGGTCIEIRADGQGLLLDIGMPLVNPDGTEFDQKSLNRPVKELIADNLLPQVKGLYDGSDCNIAGIVLTHAHQDHFGLGHFVKPGIPIFASETTRDLIGATYMFFPDHIDPARITIIHQHWQPFPVRPFTITSHPVDHSAPGAIALEVEAAGKKIFFTGDLRAHGYKYRQFENLINRPPKNVDAMLMEGSSLGRGADEYPYPDEISVRKALVNEFRDKNGLVLLFSSSQNVDRIVSACRATQNTGRELVIDYYVAYILSLLKNTSKGISDVLNNCRFLYWHGHGQALRKAEKIKFFGFIKEKKARVLPEEITDYPDKFVVIAKANRTLPQLIKGLAPKQVHCIWSMWSGYLDDPNNNFVTFCRDNNFSYKKIHTSGHATIKDLGRLVAAVNPALLIPVHTFHPDDYKQFIDPARIRVLNDGEALKL